MTDQTKLVSDSTDITDSDFQLRAPLTLSDDEVTLWRIDLEAIRGDEPRWRKLLSPDEASRADRYHFSADRQSYVAARAWLRMILASYLGANAEQLGFSYSKKEKPSLDPAHTDGGVTFNLSHSGGFALLAITRNRDIGVDVEQVRHDFDLEGIARRFFSAHEQRELFALPAEERVAAFFRCWTRKEAYIKATGDGLSLPLSQFDVSLAAEDGDALLATRPDGDEAKRWLLQNVHAGSGYAAALCVRGRNCKVTA